MSTLVVYYSRSGNTKSLAQEYAKQNNAQIVEIKDNQNRKGILGFIRSGYQASKKKIIPIEDIPADISAFDKVALCTPVWAGAMSSPMRSFICKYAGKIKQAEYIISCSAKDSKYENIFDEMDELIGIKRISAQCHVAALRVK